MSSSAVFNEAAANTVTLGVCAGAGIGSRVSLAIGGKLDAVHAKPLPVEGTVVHLDPPEAPKHVTAETVDDAQPIDRIFLSVAAHHDALAPDARLRTIYPRYLEQTSTPLPDGLTMRAFRDETALLLLIAAGAFVYGVSILLLFGRGWIFLLVRDRQTSR